MYKLEVKQVECQPIGKWYQYQLIKISDNSIVDKDSIDDEGQGMETAVKQIHSIIKRRGVFN